MCQLEDFYGYKTKCHGHSFCLEIKQSHGTMKEAHQILSVGKRLVWFYISCCLVRYM
ncbi:unnamed protein product [Musa acuminata subsp. burmannicoides]